MAHLDRRRRAHKSEIKAEEEAKAKKLLAAHNKEFKGKPSRRKSPKELFDYFSHSFFKPSKFVRDPNEWISKSYNLERQIIDFIRWIYCLYPVPQFMFDLFTRYSHARFRDAYRMNLIELMYFDWFLVMAQGGSFAKVSREIFTKKEAHLFLNAPSDNKIPENVWWARCKALDLDHSISHAVVKRLMFGLDVSDPFWSYLIVLLKNNEDIINLEFLSDIMDFLRDRHGRDKDFKLKGRTFNSLIKLSNEWHREVQLKKFGNQNMSWDGLPIPDWTWEDKQEKLVWKVRQLHSSKELYHEGRKMKHCVASYGQLCLQGASAIFTMESSDGVNLPEKHLTLEVSSSKRLNQVRGKMNKRAEGRAKFVLNKWLGTNNINTNAF